MRAAIWATLIGLLASTALAGVSAHVYRADEATPLAWADPNIPDVYQEIMVGTRLAIFIVSDIATLGWSGGLWVSREDWHRGTVSGRNYNEDEINYEGSVLGGTGEDSRVYGYHGSSGMYLYLMADDAMIGEWFVVDYQAQAVGVCDAGLYSVEPVGGPPHDFNPDFDDPPPGQTSWLQGLTFNHVLSRDYSGDHIVNFVDFALLAGQWQGMVPADPNATICPDLNADEVVEIADLTLFCEYWLERTDIEEPEPEPNMPSPEP